VPVLPPRLTDPPGPRAAKVVHVRVGEGLAPIEVEPRYDEVLLVVSLRRAVLGEVRVPARGTLTPNEQREAVLSALGHPLSVEWLRTAFLRAAGAAEPPERAAPDVSVIVCTRDRPADLRRCLDGLARLRTPPLETLVVDNAPSDDRARAACASRCPGRRARATAASSPRGASSWPSPTTTARSTRAGSTGWRRRSPTRS
jgi:hypothetical protein